ncbi:VQ motif-containing protein 11-like [Salvia hispanica]|uniref:VQ motif-containing protein 11-like n=1 Tax=Salvia hispanica TaxID=49212 RepID=UPI0020099D7F|nr:VQ motif-containing protein 11-like [Salvia hispanica]
MASSSDLNPSPSFFTRFDPNSIFVQADPSTFRAVVQRLTGKTISGDIGPRRPAFKLQERRPTAIKLVKLHNSPAISHRRLAGEGMLMASPVSPLECMAAPEERGSGEKGFYLQPSPLSTPRGSHPPELLPLFPLRSPTDN